MIRWLLGDFFAWVRPQALLIRPSSPHSTQATYMLRVRRILTVTLAVFVLIAFSVGASSDWFTVLDPVRWLDLTWRSLWVASLLLQGCASLLVVITIRSRDRNEILRTTPSGLALWVRSQWLAALLRARVLILYIVLLRGVMLVLFLIEVTALRGTYLDLVAVFNMASPLPLPVLMVLCALGMTVALLLPLVALAFDSMIGLLTAYTLSERTFALTYQVGWLAIRWGGMVASIWLYDRVANGDILVASTVPMPLYAASVLVGDHGATFTSLTRMVPVWNEIPDSAWIAVGGVVLLIAYALLTELGLWATRYRLERHD